jgi:hypothetical protein
MAKQLVRHNHGHLGVVTIGGAGTLVAGSEA